MEENIAWFAALLVLYFGIQANLLIITHTLDDILKKLNQPPTAAKEDK